MEVISIIHTVYITTKGLIDWLDERKEKDQVVVQISSIIVQLHGILSPLSANHSTHDVAEDQQLIDCLKRIEEIITTTKEHLFVWDRSRTNRLIAFFSPASVTKELKDDGAKLDRQLLILLVAMKVTEHVRGRQQFVTVTAPPPLHTSPTPQSPDEAESKIRVFWREFIGEKVLSIPALIFCQKLATWMRKSISDVGVQRLLLWLDETGSGRITLLHVEEQVGPRNFRDTVVTFSEDPFLPLLICIGNNPMHYYQQATYALESNVTIVQLSSTAQAIAWIGINSDFIRRHDSPSSIRFIADNVRVKTDPTSGTPVINHSAGLNILKHIRNIGINAPLLIRANTSIQATIFVEAFSMAGSTTHRGICRDYIAALGAGKNNDFEWRKFMA